MTNPNTPTISNQCPACKQDVRFSYIGEQHWPKAVAEKLSLPELVYLYQCSECNTTLTHVELVQS